MTYKLEDIRVLVIDDIKPMRDLTESILGILGFNTVFQAENGEHAMQMIMDKDPDFIITDWLMTPIDGLQLTRQIRGSNKVPNPYVPVIMVTGFSSRLRVEEARDAGVTEFLVKPFTSQDLFSRLQHIVEKPRQFVDTGQFFGPDRRRKKLKDYTGPQRRDNDKYDFPQITREEDDFLKQLRDDVSSI
ncbi:MAG: response regulator [Micavibrio sp.]|nr:response regulator [Micavibrio sp.]